MFWDKLTNKVADKVTDSVAEKVNEAVDEDVVKYALIALGVGLAAAYILGMHHGELIAYRKVLGRVL